MRLPIQRVVGVVLEQPLDATDDVLHGSDLTAAAEGTEPPPRRKREPF
jgi:hypothetical protein